MSPRRRSPPARSPPPAARARRAVRSHGSPPRVSPSCGQPSSTPYRQIGGRIVGRADFLTGISVRHTVATHEDGTRPDARRVGAASGVPDGMADAASLWGAVFDEAVAEYAAVANAISAFEPVVMVAAPGAGRDAEAVLAADVEVLELPIDDSWMRDCGPIFVVGADGSRDGRRLPLQLVGRALPAVRQGRRGDRAGRRRAGLRAAPVVDGAGGRLDHGRRRGDADHDRAVPAESEPQPGAHPRRHRGRARRAARRRARHLAALRPCGRRAYRRARRRRLQLRRPGDRRGPGLRGPEPSRPRAHARQPRGARRVPRTRAAGRCASSSCPSTRTSTSTGSARWSATSTSTSPTAASSSRSPTRRSTRPALALLREAFPDREVVGVPARVIAARRRRHPLHHAAGRRRHDGDAP